MEQIINIKTKHLEILQDRMKFLSSESNSYSNKYLLGGTITVITLLNMDLVMENQIISNNLISNLIFLSLVMAISFIYFYLVARRIERFNQSYRKAKYKYEILLYDLLKKDPNIINQLETDLQETLKENRVFEFGDLQKHHYKKYKNINWKGIISLPILIVLLTIIVKIFYNYKMN